MNDLSSKRELYEAAKDLYEDTAFKAALDKARQDYLADLINGELATERKLEIIAELRALDRVVGAIRRLMSDYTMDRGRRRG